MESQPSIEHFENLLHQQLLEMDFSRTIWIEDESRKIGTIVLLEAFWKQIKSVPVVLVKLSVEERVKFLVEEYGNFSNEELRSSILKIAKRLGGQNLNAALEALETGNLSEVAAISLHYYDKAYRHALETRHAQIEHQLVIDGLSHQQIAENIIQLNQL
jgi:tRNA 2-selenouridine synthase